MRLLGVQSEKIGAHAMARLAGSIGQYERAPTSGLGGGGRCQGSGNGSKAWLFMFDCLLLCFELHYCGFDVLTSRAFEGA
jgi:hypothetical protein